MIQQGDHLNPQQVSKPVKSFPLTEAAWERQRRLGQTKAYNLLEGWRAAITVGTNDGPLTGLSNRYW